LLNATADFTGFPPLPEIKECAAAHDLQLPTR
jgi:hypothetical protein